MKTTAIKNMLIALLAVCVLGLAFTPVAAQGDASVAKSSPSGDVPEGDTQSSVSLSGGQPEDDAEGGIVMPLAAGDAVITVGGVAAGGLQAAVTAANGTSGDFSALQELYVTSGTLTTTDFFFLATLPAVQILDMAGCGVVDGSVSGTGLLANRTNLISVSMPAANPYYMGGSMFMGCTSLVSANVSRAYGFGGSFFQGCTSLQNVVLPSAAYVVSSSMFMGCTALTSINLSTAVVIDNNAFTNCTALRSVNMSGVNKTIYSYVFFNCTSLVDVTLPTACTIGSGAFSGCTSLTEMDLSGAQLTGDNVFFGDTALQSISIPADGVFPAYTYGNCTALTAVDVSAATSLGTGLFSGCTGIQDAVLSASYALPESIFQNCVSLQEIDLRGATAFGESALAGCLRLTDVAMPQRFMPIAPSMFTGCESLERIDLTYATGFGAFAFNSCYHLYDITWPATAPADTALGLYAFALTAQDFTKGFPAGSGITADKIARIAPSQNPRVYFSLPNGTSGTITQGSAFPDPWALQTQFGTGYAEMCTDPAYASWRVNGLQPPAVATAVALNGVPVAGVDTSIPGVYTIHYSIPPDVFADNHELDYTLTVVPAGSSSTSTSPLPPSSSSAAPFPGALSQPSSPGSVPNASSPAPCSESSSMPVSVMSCSPSAGGSARPGCVPERPVEEEIVPGRQTCCCICMLLLVLILLALALFSWFIWRRRKRRNAEDDEK